MKKVARYDYLELDEPVARIEVDRNEVKRIVRQVVRSEIRSLVAAAVSRAMREAKQRHHGLF